MSSIRFKKLKIPELARFHESFVEAKLDWKAMFWNQINVRSPQAKKKKMGMYKKVNSESKRKTFAYLSMMAWNLSSAE